MNTSLRDQLIAVGFDAVPTPTPKMNNSFEGKASPTMNACYQTELYQHRGTIRGLKRKTIKARDFSYGFVRISKARIIRAMEFEATFQATRKADRALKPTRPTKVVSLVQRKGDWNEAL
jgi:hypothetical protein